MIKINVFGHHQTGKSSIINYLSKVTLCDDFQLTFVEKPSYSNVMPEDINIIVFRMNVKYDEGCALIIKHKLFLGSIQEPNIIICGTFASKKLEYDRSPVDFFEFSLIEQHYNIGLKNHLLKIIRNQLEFKDKPKELEPKELEPKELESKDNKNSDIINRQVSREHLLEAMKFSRGSPTYNSIKSALVLSFKEDLKKQISKVMKEKEFTDKEIEDVFNF